MWNAHTSVGNILGSLVSAAMLKRGGDGWGNAFVVNGVLTIACGWLVHNFLVVAPEDAGLPSPHGGEQHETLVSSSSGNSGGELGVLEPEGRDGNVGGDVGSIGSATSKTQKYPHSPKTFAKKPPAAGFKAALKIPGVVTFSLCLFFTKLVAYTFLYWLPFYIERTEIGGVYLTPAQAGRLSTLFDIGGVAGGAFVFEFFESSDCSRVADGDYLRQKQHDPLASNRRRTRPQHHVITTSVTFPVTNKYPTTPPPQNKKVFSPGTSATNSTRAP